MVFMTGSHGLLVLLFLSIWKARGISCYPHQKNSCYDSPLCSTSLIEENMGAFEVIGLYFFSCMYCSLLLRGKHSVMGKKDQKAHLSCQETLAYAPSLFFTSSLFELSSHIFVLAKLLLLSNFNSITFRLARWLSQRADSESKVNIRSTDVSSASWPVSFNACVCWCAMSLSPSCTVSGMGNRRSVVHIDFAQPRWVIAVLG